MRPFRRADLWPAFDLRTPSLTCWSFGLFLTLRWTEMDSNFRFPDAPSGRSAEARTFSSDREFAPLAWRDRDFEPPAPSRVGPYSSTAVLLRLSAALAAKVPSGVW